METIGIIIAAVATILLIILFCVAGAKVSKRADEWEEKYWEDKE